MKVDLFNLEKSTVGDVDLNDHIFNVDFIRLDLIKRVVDWQRLKAMSGTRSTKNISEVSGTTKKPFKQKGTGNARQGSLRSVHMRGGAVSHGPRVRSHAIGLQKKVRVLGMKHALSLKQELGDLFIVDNLAIKEPKTTIMKNALEKFGEGKYFIIDAEVVNNNTIKSVRSLANAKIVPTIGANVYDIMNADKVLIAKDALPLLDKRLG